MLSHLNYTVYASYVVGPSLNKDLSSRLSCLHNRAVRVTCGLRKYDHVSDCRLELCWLPLDLLIQHYVQVLRMQMITILNSPVTLATSILILHELHLILQTF